MELFNIRESDLSLECVGLISCAHFWVLPPTACIADSRVGCRGRLRQELSPDRGHEDTQGRSTGLKKVKHWSCCRRLSQQFCNSLLQQVSLALASRLNLPKHSMDPVCLSCIQARAKLKRQCFSLGKCASHGAWYAYFRSRTPLWQAIHWTFKLLSVPFVLTEKSKMCLVWTWIWLHELLDTPSEY